MDKNFQSWFIPKLRSKYVTFEILQFTCQFKYQVIILLRSLCKKSDAFLDRLLHEIQKTFNVCQFTITPQLLLDPLIKNLKSNKKEQSSLNFYAKAQKLDYLEDCFKLNLKIMVQLDDNNRYYRFDQNQAQNLYEVLKNDDSEFDSILISFDFKYSSHFEVKNEPVMEIIQKLCIITKENQLRAKEIVFHRNHQGVLDQIIGYFLQKDINTSNQYFSSITAAKQKGEMPEEVYNIKFSGYNLESLVFQKQLLNVRGLKQLSSMLINCQNISSLTLEEIMPPCTDLQYHPFCDQMIETMKSLQYLTNLKSLNISRNHFADDFLKLLVPVIRPLKLKYLDISANHLSEEGISASKELFQNNYLLHELRFDYNKFRNTWTTKVIPDIFKAIPNLKILSLKMCRLSDNLISELCPGFHCGLQRLNLSFNRITKDGIQAIAEHYEKVTEQIMLEVLELDNNELNDFSFPSLAKILKYCKNLKKFDLSQNLFMASRYEMAKLKYYYRINLIF
ncbi:UNKNOWN [Stylonychia lemnae]|uniref:Leucine rich repeat family protein n=1 Tax=Stylonychia lemnae TaxID=5949 RepID=A0A078AGG7_STYLE|nr:UNKNOWN [Stylonychia lemnae]|eukprot:CDW80906.1 UNKNOWN [Stylonychia lemnae]